MPPVGAVEKPAVVNVCNRIEGGGARGCGGQQAEALQCLDMIGVELLAAKRLGKVAVAVDQCDRIAGATQQVAARKSAYWLATDSSEVQSTITGLMR